MESYNNFYQLVVNYNAIFDLKDHIRKILAPYMRFKPRIGLEHEGKFTETYVLIFPDEKSSIHISWNSLYFRSQGDFKKMVTDNGYFDWVFKPILKELTEMENFSQISQVLLFSQTILFKDQKQTLSEFTDKYLPKNLMSIFTKTTDSAIRIEGEKNKSSVNINFGPYFGRIDLEKSNIKSQFESDVDIDKTGILIESTISKPTNQFSRTQLKEILKTHEDIIKEI